MIAVLADISGEFNMLSSQRTVFLEEPLRTFICWRGGWEGMLVKCCVDV